MKKDADAPAERRWGFMENGAFIEVPRAAQQQAGYETTPFTVTLPDGIRQRTIIEEPLLPTEYRVWNRLKRYLNLLAKVENNS